MRSSTGELSWPCYVTFERIVKDSRGERMGGSARRVGKENRWQVSLRD
jgi:hypothetical protein